MVGTSGGHDFFGTESRSDDETFDNFGEHEAKEDELLHGCDSYGALDENLIFIKPSPSGVHEDKFEPFIGMIFPSLDAARDFYYEYAKHTGFTIRTNRIRHSQKNMAIIGRDFVCSREGFRAAKHALKKDRVLPPRPITREGCKAMIRLAAKDVGSWIVTKFVRDHSHKLMTKCNFAGELPTVNILSEEEKDKKILELNNELQHERERSSTFREQLHTILKDLEEHAEFMSIRVEDIVNTMKGFELDDD
ncbi:protein FAR1-RELATED SEQUENCE 5-like [Rhododendron vialii]|uniref:protein FAR1-RELATED SEQUENCE 5-like n=1 Tax=Rhododendron vialii TaxID=182163 RepID=UPI00265E0FF7|nr:protein FAR1-RELATED SEQUENCE 5-like [Rhododendron vialii]XP_058186773.1 protein FAR1-RELATED SEQUENCE 5-like [Rhododendron vialii]XP_058186775.1 protein FAR1-RELATED SEQUENCE 5-like [Rhododendron vialii]